MRKSVALQAPSSNSMCPFTLLEQFSLLAVSTTPPAVVHQSVAFRVEGSFFQRLSAAWNVQNRCNAAPNPCYWQRAWQHERSRNRCCSLTWGLTLCGGTPRLPRSQLTLLELKRVQCSFVGVAKNFLRSLRQAHLHGQSAFEVSLCMRNRLRNVFCSLWWRCNV